MSLTELYQEMILDHYQQPRNQGDCSQCAVVVHHDNPLCGDEITLGLDFVGGCIQRLIFSGKGCAISQASASMMTESVQGQNAENVLRLAEQVRQMMHGQPVEEEVGDLLALEGVARFPVRIKCALMPWAALQDALARASTPPG
jgi:nitrogen fixation NifU-like protein